MKKSTYLDSISLMKISNALSKLPGVAQAAVVMATELNRRVLSEAGFADATIGQASTSDMIVAVEAADGTSLDSAFAEMEKMLKPSEKKPGELAEPTSLDEAVERRPDSNLAFISVPGQFAKREAMRALSKGMDVFLFSSNVTREEEVELKAVSKGKGLLLMGPDCGTSIINHKVLGFGNTIRAGTIGLASASGTGLQEVTTLIHKAGLGITQAIGTGGSDLSEEVGGITMIQGLDLLEADAATRVIVLISKPPGPLTMQKLLNVAAGSKKPVVVNFLGGEVKAPKGSGLRMAGTLEEAASIACELAGAKHVSTELPSDTVSQARLANERLSASQKYVRGLFSGGTLCYESQVILRDLLGEVYSNAPLNPTYMVQGEGPSKGHCCIDMGSEEFVEGRPHPMIDFSLRNIRILQEAKDPETAVVLLDVELGFGSNDDPAGQLSPAIRKAMDFAKGAGRSLTVVASVIGTDGDAQGLAKQEEVLRKAGVLILPSNAQATRIAALIANGKAVLPKMAGVG